MVAHAHSKSVEVAAPKTSLTPCLPDHDHAQLDLLSAAMEDMGYQAITTSDPEEALGLVRSGQCRQHRGLRRPEGRDWRPLALDEVRKLHIQRVLELCLGNRLRAAQILGIGRTSLYRYRKCDGYATVGSYVLFLKGTVSRVRAAILLTGIRKTRKMRSLRQQRLASALQLARALTKAKSQSFQPLNGRAG
jgi:DNA-binding protein Fis